MKRLLRVTQLEKFRRYITEHSEYDDERSVIDNLTGQFTGNQYTRVGTAFHKIVERRYPRMQKDPGDGDGDPGEEFDIDGYPVKLDLKQCKTALEYKDRFPNAFHEIREYMDMGEIIITGCADIINGLEIRDIKTKYSPIRTPIIRIVASGDSIWSYSAWETSFSTCSSSSDTTRTNMVMMSVDWSLSLTPQLSYVIGITLWSKTIVSY
ncbi:hypothetical protein [Parabacteroides distasonis]|uniref:hypothetical protein n=1 Tax=Parabacteroides distasonis TaxID=823 RepID=UPI0021C7402D|nr:hypothetical protein [Parabacteroides distasonis]